MAAIIVEHEVFNMADLTIRGAHPIFLDLLRAAENLITQRFGSLLASRRSSVEDAANGGGGGGTGIPAPQYGVQP